MSNETTETTAAAHAEACDRLTDAIIAAIGRSLSHTERVTVALPMATDFGDAHVCVSNVIDGDYDYATENDGSEDLWGDHEGETFRLLLTHDA
jgi:hypothetical protein